MTASISRRSLIGAGLAGAASATTSAAFAKSQASVPGFEIPKKWGKETELVVCPDRDGTYYVRLGTKVHFSCKRIALAE